MMPLTRSRSAACQSSACKAAHAQHGLNGPQHGIALPQVLHDHHRDAHYHRRDLHKVHQRHDARQPRTTFEGVQ